MSDHVAGGIESGDDFDVDGLDIGRRLGLPAMEHTVRLAHDGASFLLTDQERLARGLVRPSLVLLLLLHNFSSVVPSGAAVSRIDPENPSG